MPDNRSLTVRIASKQDFSAFILALIGLILLACILSPHPVLLTAVAVITICAAFKLRLFGLSAINAKPLTLIISTAGNVQFSSGHENGHLHGQQWCTRHLTVLNIATAAGTQHLPVLRKQQSEDEYRRLSVWLRLSGVSQ